MVTPDVSVVVTGHREGALCRPTFAALSRSIEDAASAGISVEVVGVLDRADAATVAIFESALAVEGDIGRLARTRTRVTDHGDPGAARNDGIRDTLAPWVCVLDGDNLPSRSWLTDALRIAETHGAPCVVHPEYLLIFGDRWQAWPQLPSADPGFRVHNFFDRTYWDTFCLASREVFTTTPYVPTTAERGLGPEDWHWGMATFHAGIVHLSATGTALLYRSKSSDSVQGGHEIARSLLPPSPLLVDRALAAHSDEGPREARPRWRGLQRAIVRESLADAADSRPRPLVRDSEAQFNPLHYRALNPEVLRLGNGQATAHYLDSGRARALRARLSDAELRDVAALDLGDYQALHSDLADLEDDDLLHHYLAHGRAEGRSESMTIDQRDARLQVSLSDDMVLELQALHALDHDIPDPTPTHLAALSYVGPPSDGSMTLGSRVWWQVVEALGPGRPDVFIYVSHLTADPASDADCASVLRRLPPESRVAIVATHGSSMRPSWMDSEVVLIDLHEVTGWHQIAEVERRRLLATLVVQFQPDVVYALDSPEFSAALVEYGLALRSSTSISGS